MEVGASLDPAALISQRWFAAPGKPIASVTVAERFNFASGAALAILRIEVERGGALWRSMPIESADGRGPWVELLELATHGGSIATAGLSQLVGHAPPRPNVLSGRSVESLGKDQSHSSVVVDDSTVLKLYRALTQAPNPEVELGAALANDTDAPVPAYRGAVTAVVHPRTPGARPEELALAFAQEYVPHAGDAFEELADRLAAWLRAGAPQRALPSLIVDALPAARATARLHACLEGLLGSSLAPRLARSADTARWRQQAAKAHRTATRLLKAADSERANWLAARRDQVDRALGPLAAAHANGSPPALQRIHGDLHLGQLLRDGGQFLIGDLEGEPTRPIDERRRIDTPLRDLASMLRSFDHVARSGMRRSGVPLDAVASGTSAADPATDAWLAAMRTAFLDAYAVESGVRGLVVEIDVALLHALEVEKELYEFSYATSYLPAWMYAPAAGMRWLLDHPA